MATIRTVSSFLLCISVIACGGNSQTKAPITAAKSAADEEKAVRIKRYETAIEAIVITADSMSKKLRAGENSSISGFHRSLEGLLSEVPSEPDTEQHLGTYVAATRLVTFAKLAADNVKLADEYLQMNRPDDAKRLMGDAVGACDSMMNIANSLRRLSKDKAK